MRVFTTLWVFTYASIWPQGKCGMKMTKKRSSFFKPLCHKIFLKPNFWKKAKKDSSSQKLYISITKIARRQPWFVFFLCSMWAPSKLHALFFLGNNQNICYVHTRTSQSQNKTKQNKIKDLKPLPHTWAFLYVYQYILDFSKEVLYHTACNQKVIQH